MSNQYTLIENNEQILNSRKDLQTCSIEVIPPLQHETTTDPVRLYNILIEKVRNNHESCIESEDRSIFNSCAAAGKKVKERIALGIKSLDTNDQLYSRKSDELNMQYDIYKKNKALLSFLALKRLEVCNEDFLVKTDASLKDWAQGHNDFINAVIDDPKELANIWDFLENSKRLLNNIPNRTAI